MEIGNWTIERAFQIEKVSPCRTPAFRPMCVDINRAALSTEPSHICADMISHIEVVLR